MHRRVGESIIRSCGRATDSRNFGWITAVAAHDALSVEMYLLRWGQDGKALKGMPKITPDMERDILSSVIGPFMASALVASV